MRKGTILLAAIFAVSLATGAEAAKKKAAPAPAADPAAKANQDTRLLVGDFFRPWTPQRPTAGAPPGKKVGKRG